MLPSYQVQRRHIDASVRGRSSGPAQDDCARPPAAENFMDPHSLQRRLGAKHNVMWVTIDDSLDTAENMLTVICQVGLMLRRKLLRIDAHFRRNMQLIRWVPR